METVNRLGTFDDVLAASSKEVGDICRARAK